jgi:two-component system response regulator RegA
MGRLLLVEDEAILLDILRQAFVLKHWEVDTATTADEALARFAQTTPDVVLTDKNLPGGAIDAAQAGVELVRAIRKRDPAVGIVMMTAFGTLESARDTLNLGVDEYLEKRTRSRRTAPLARMTGQTARESEARPRRHHRCVRAR